MFRYFSSVVAPRLKEESAEIPQAAAKSVTFYRRELPAHLISFTSTEGKRLFKESLESGYAENYFPLVGNFTTQSEPEFCALGSLAMVLNALELDPGKQWKGVWRWYSDDNLECSAVNANSIKGKGVTFREFACLAKCNGLSVQSKRSDTVTKEEFMADLQSVCQSVDSHMVVSFSRKTLGQTGDGHFSPIGAFNKERNMALVLDTARFKYPSYFASADMLFESMKPIDKETGLPRGYFVLKRGSTKRCSNHLSLCRLTHSIGVSNPKLANLFCSQLPKHLKEINPSSLVDAICHILRFIPAEYSALISVNDVHSNAVDLASPTGKPGCDLVREFDKELSVMLRELTCSPLFTSVKAAMSVVYGKRERPQVYEMLRKYTGIAPEDLDASLATIFILSCPREVFRTLDPVLLQEIDAYRRKDAMSDVLRPEVERISEQLSTLMNDYCKCFQKNAALEKLPSVRLSLGCV